MIHPTSGRVRIVGEREDLSLNIRVPMRISRELGSVVTSNFRVPPHPGVEARLV